ncbi:zinc ribbon-containing protein [Marinobacterium marinum]|uniref:Metalloendopeptidase n=1 Tax=Marinobacterium marinum TaxID=2756129 RepID=A0A7W1X0E8_9GAMM|nr:metalloendopeptidase [Marinobacterium marinum]MBA4503468.1 metalloendopeptidase [Marinobacterium marinum]
MSKQEPNLPKHSEQAPAAYDRVLEQLRQRLDKAGEVSWEYLQEQIEEAAEMELAAEDMTRDEVDLLKAYLRRDLKQLGYYAHETGEGIAAWLHFDLDVLEHKVKQSLLELADKTRIQHELLREQLAHDEDHYLAGEVSAPGTLRCLQCGELQQLKATDRIKPCSRCGAVVFERVSRPWSPVGQ